MSAAPALERLLREEWGRLLALLVAQYRRLDLAEDALGDAVEAASRRWPADGVPVNPAGWLLVAARRRVVDRLRSEAVAVRSLPLLATEAGLSEEAGRVMADGTTPGEAGAADERLRLVLLCAHPSLPRDAAAALTLRLVLGVATADIARLFLVSTPTMAARLTRARKRLAGAAFTVPTGEALRDRLADVADIAYLAFTAGYAPGTGPDVVRVEAAGEAVRLVRVVREVADAAAGVSAETRADLDALLALVLLQHSRRDARVADGAIVLLPDQDRRRWRTDEIGEAIGLLLPQVAEGRSTPYLLQALIAAEHAVAPSAAATDWPRIAGWYAELEQLTGSPVVRLNRAVALAEARGPVGPDGPDEGLRLLEGLDLPGHRLPAVRAELLARAGRHAESLAAYDAALGACDHPVERAHLAGRRALVADRVSRPQPPG